MGLTLQASTPHGKVSVDLPNHVIQDIIRDLAANPQLDSLDMIECDIESGEHWKALFQAVTDHEGLQSFHIEEYPSCFDEDRSWLTQLLAKKKNFDLRDINSREICAESESEGNDNESEMSDYW